MKTYILALVLASWVCSTPGLSQQVTNNPTYSWAVYAQKDPHQVLSDAEASFNKAQTMCDTCGSGQLAMAAKAALEAGENQKAQDYALRALAMANQLEAQRAKYASNKRPRPYAGIPRVDYYANFVLGRLAILNGDIRSAEQYLLASGRTAGHGAMAGPPNLSLALELLKHGDQQSWKVVQQFIDELRVFVKVQNPPFDAWSAQIAAGKIPDFQAGDGYLYR